MPNSITLILIIIIKNVVIIIIILLWSNGVTLRPPLDHIKYKVRFADEDVNI